MRVTCVPGGLEGAKLYLTDVLCGTAQPSTRLHWGLEVTHTGSRISKETTCNVVYFACFPNLKVWINNAVLP